MLTQKDERDQYLNVYQDGLLSDVVPFWTRYGIDHEQGGIMTGLDQTGSIIDTDKGVWQQGRSIWMFGELYNQLEQRKEWLDLALQGLNFLERYCFDPVDGRMWFHVTREGLPIRKRRYAYSEAFASIAYGEVAKATNSKVYAQKAEALFHQYIAVNNDPKEKKFTDIRPTRNVGVPMIGISLAQELRDSIGLTDATLQIDRWIEEIRRFHYKKDIQCLVESVGINGELLDHFDGRTLNPGHALECSWFLMRESACRNDSELLQMGIDILNWMWKRGWDSEFGGIRYFVDLYGHPVSEYWHDMKFWWVHNETILATLYAWKLTGDLKYARMHHEVHSWTYQHFPDPLYGEWFGYLHRDGSISSTLKGNLWKGFFHIPRMQLLASRLLLL